MRCASALCALVLVAGCSSPAPPAERVDRPIHIDLPHTRGCGVFDPAYDAFVRELIRLDERDGWPDSVPRWKDRPRLRVSPARLGPHHTSWLDPAEVARTVADRIGRTGRLLVELGPAREPAAEVQVEIATPEWAPGQLRPWTVLIMLRGDGGHVVTLTLTRFESLDAN